MLSFDVCCSDDIDYIEWIDYRWFINKMYWFLIIYIISLVVLSYDFTVLVRDITHEYTIIINNISQNHMIFTTLTFLCVILWWLRTVFLAYFNVCIFGNSLSTVFEIINLIKIQLYKWICQWYMSTYCHIVRTIYNHDPDIL